MYATNGAERITALTTPTGTEIPVGLVIARTDRQRIAISQVATKTTRIHHDWSW
jgi:hypothetical protein